MQTPESQIIVKRFFEALQALKDKKVIRGKQTFTSRYDINRWNLNTQEREPERDQFQMSWLGYLVKDYGVSAEWLLTGDGEIFDIKASKDKEILAKAREIVALIDKQESN